MTPGIQKRIQGVDMRKPDVPGYKLMFDDASIAVLADKAAGATMFGITISSNRYASDTTTTIVITAPILFTSLPPFILWLGEVAV